MVAPVVHGRTLAVRSSELLQRGDTACLAALLAPEFQLQRANGIGASKQQYLRSPAEAERFTLSRFKASRSGTIIVVRYGAVTSKTIDGVEFPTPPAPRLSIFRRGPEGWRIIAHANFNAPP